MFGATILRQDGSVEMISRPGASPHLLESFAFSDATELVDQMAKRLRKGDVAKAVVRVFREPDSMAGLDTELLQLTSALLKFNTGAVKGSSLVGGTVHLWGSLTARMAAAQGPTGLQFGEAHTLSLGTPSSTQDGGWAWVLDASQITQNANIQLAKH